MRSCTLCGRRAEIWMPCWSCWGTGKKPDGPLNCDECLGVGKLPYCEKCAPAKASELLRAGLSPADLPPGPWRSPTLEDFM